MKGVSVTFFVGRGIQRVRDTGCGVHTGITYVVKQKDNKHMIAFNLCTSPRNRGQARELVRFTWAVESGNGKTAGPERLSGCAVH